MVRFGALSALVLFLIVPLGGAVPSPTGKSVFAISIAPDPPHLLDHPVEVGENRQARIPIIVTATASEFVCSADVTFVIEFPSVTFPDQWAMASMGRDDEKITITVERGDPGPLPDSESTYTATKQGILEVFWREDRPKTDAIQTYNVSAIVLPPADDTCAPDYATRNANMLITAEGDDILETNAPPKDCEAVPDLPECQSFKDDKVEPAAESPGVDAAVVLMAVGLLALLVRRRK